jgi:hypothetical protein
VSESALPGWANLYGMFHDVRSSFARSRVVGEGDENTVLRKLPTFPMEDDVDAYGARHSGARTNRV